MKRSFSVLRVLRARPPHVGHLLAISLLLVLPVGAEPAGDAVVARVNGTAITVDRFNASFVRRLIQTGRNDTPEERLAHLHELIDTYLLAEEARRQGLEDEAYLAFADRQIEKAVGDRYYQITFLDSLPDLTDAELREAFIRSKDKVVVRHLLFPTAEAAWAAHARLEGGADFLALAAEVFGTAPTDSAAGFLGVATYWELADPLAVAAYEMEVGTYSEPIRTRYGWHILRLENRILEPLLTESEYQYRRGFIRSQSRLRRMRLEGDRFVRAFMESLDVTVDPEALVQLEAAIRQATAGTDETAPPRTSLTTEEVATIREELTPETLLAAYTFEGERRPFTAQEYAAWLPELPMGELRHRTAASVGRALRNEALALAGFTQKLERDPAVIDEVHYRTSVYLANRLRDTLRTSGTATPTEAELQEGFTRLGYDQLKAATATYWIIPFASLGEAEAAKRAIVTGQSRADAYPAYTYVEGDDLLGSGERNHHLRRAPLEVPLVIGTADGGWWVAEVETRTLTYTTFDEAKPQIEAVLRTYLPEFRLVKTLRTAAQVEINHGLFEQMQPIAGTR